MRIFLAAAAVVMSFSGIVSADLIVSNFSHSTIVGDSFPGPSTALTNDVVGTVKTDNRFSGGTSTIGEGEFIVDLPTSDGNTFQLDSSFVLWEFDPVDVSSGYESLELEVFDAATGTAAIQVTVLATDSFVSDDGGCTDCYQITTENGLPDSIALTEMSSLDLTQVNRISIGLFNFSGLGGIGSPALFSSTNPSLFFQADAVECREGADFDGDGVVSFSDFLILSGNFGAVADDSTGDANCDGTADFTDFLVLSSSFGQTVEAIASVPEPSVRGTWILVALLLVRPWVLNRHR